MAWEELGTSGWAPRWCSPSDNLASPVPQSYCLKVKEMDDEEYSCIVSATAGGSTAVVLERLRVHKSSPAYLTEPQEWAGSARDTRWARPIQERPGGLARLLFLEIWGDPPTPGPSGPQSAGQLAVGHSQCLLPHQLPPRLCGALAGKN